MTRKQFERLPRYEQAAVYFSHGDNLVQGKNNSRGPSTWAQYRFWNDWRNAIETFAQSLPNQ